MERVAADVEAFHLGIANFDSFLVNRRVEDSLDLESGLSCSSRDRVDDGGMVCEWAAAPVLRNAAEQAMLDPVPVRRAWRVVANLDGQSGLVRELSGVPPSRASHAHHLIHRNPP
jgi:hypothetical protein